MQGKIGRDYPRERKAVAMNTPEEQARIIANLSDEEWIQSEIRVLMNEPPIKITAEQLKERSKKTLPFMLAVRCCEMLIEHREHASIWKAIEAECDKQPEHHKPIAFFEAGLTAISSEDACKAASELEGLLSEYSDFASPVLLERQSLFAGVRDALGSIIENGRYISNWTGNYLLARSRMSRLATVVTMLVVAVLSWFSYVSSIKGTYGDYKRLHVLLAEEHWDEALPLLEEVQISWRHYFNPLHNPLEIDLSRVAALTHLGRFTEAERLIGKTVSKPGLSKFSRAKLAAYDITILASEGKYLELSKKYGTAESRTVLAHGTTHEFSASIYNIGSAALAVGEYEAAVGFLFVATQTNGAIDSKSRNALSAFANYALALDLNMQNDHAEKAYRVAESVFRSGPSGNERTATYASLLNNQAAIQINRGDFVEADVLLARAETLLQGIETTSSKLEDHIAANRKIQQTQAGKAKLYIVAASF